MGTIETMSLQQVQAMSTMLSISSALRIPLASPMPSLRRMWVAGQGARRGMIEWLRTAARRRQEREALARLDERQLRDMGLSRSLVMRELDKWFWQG